MKAIKPRAGWQARSKVAVRLHRQRSRLKAARPKAITLRLLQQTMNDLDAVVTEYRTSQSGCTEVTG